MLRIAFRWGIVTTALVAPLLGACFDYHTAEECLDIGTCAPPDAGDGRGAMMDVADSGDN